LHHEFTVLVVKCVKCVVMVNNNQMKRSGVRRASPTQRCFTTPPDQRSVGEERARWQAGVAACAARWSAAAESNVAKRSRLAAGRVTWRCGAVTVGAWNVPVHAGNVGARQRDGTWSRPAVRACSGRSRLSTGCRCAGGPAAGCYYSERSEEPRVDRATKRGIGPVHQRSVNQLSVST